MFLLREAGALRAAEAVRGSVLHRLGYTQGGSCRDCTIGERVGSRS
jgi:hypothetical protein